MTDEVTVPADALATETSDGWIIRHWLNDNALSLHFALWENGDHHDDPDGWSYSGWVKWDGCINWQTSPSGYAHVCEPADIDMLKRAFEALYVIGAERITEWDG